VITGQAAIAADSLVKAWLMAKATANRSIDEVRLEEMDVVAGNIVPGTGFTIYGKTRNARIRGEFAVGWEFS
jgi:hypothetical protein